MDNNKSQQIFHFDEHYIKKICISLENGMLHEPILDK